MRAQAIVYLHHDQVHQQAKRNRKLRSFVVISDENETSRVAVSESVLNRMDLWPH